MFLSQLFISKKMPLMVNLGTHTAALYAFIGENLSEERFPLTEAVPSVSCADISPHCGESAPNPFPKTFNRILPHDRVHLKDLKNSLFLACTLSWGKINTESFRKGV